MNPHRNGYLRTVSRITATAGMNAGDLGESVIACPGWTCRDLLEHLVGITEDWVIGNLDRYASESWTAAQIIRHRDEHLGDLMGQ